MFQAAKRTIKKGKHQHAEQALFFHVFQESEASKERARSARHITFSSTHHSSPPPVYRGGEEVAAIHRLERAWTNKQNISESGNEFAIQIKLTYQYKVSRHSLAVHQDKRDCYHHKMSLRYNLSCQHCDNSGPQWLYKCSFYSTASRSHH